MTLMRSLPDFKEHQRRIGYHIERIQAMNRYVSLNDSDMVIEALVRDKLYGAEVDEQVMKTIEDMPARSSYEIKREAKYTVLFVKFLAGAEMLPQYVNNAFKKDPFLYDRVIRRANKLSEEYITFLAEKGSDALLFRLTMYNITGNRKYRVRRTSIASSSHNKELWEIASIIRYYYNAKYCGENPPCRVIDKLCTDRALYDIANRIAKAANKVITMKSTADKCAEKDHGAEQLVGRHRRREHSADHFPDSGYHSPNRNDSEENGQKRNNTLDEDVNAPADVINIAGRKGDTVSKSNLPLIWGSGRFHQDTEGENRGVAFRKSPREIYEYLDQNVIGQTEAKKAVASLAFEQSRGRRRNLFIVGPSGSGKTELLRTLQKIDPLVYIFDAANITNEGFKGDIKYYSVFKEMISCGFGKWQAEHSIVVFDEFDKIVTPFYTSHDENVSSSIQAEFLKMVEGTTLSIRDRAIDTSNVCFVFLGAFEELREKLKKKAHRKSLGFGESLESSDIHLAEEPELNMRDLIDYGLRNELAGRIGKIVQVNALTGENYERIIRDVMSKKVAQEYGIEKFDISDEVISDIAKEAMNSGMGARDAYNLITDRIDALMFDTGEIPATV